MEVKKAIFDLDDTCYPWFSVYSEALEVEAQLISKIRGIRIEEVRNQMREVFTNANLVDNACLVQDMELAQEMKTRELIDLVLAVKETFSTVADGQFKLYPGVRKTLAELGIRNIELIAISDTPAQAVNQRLHQTKLAPMFNRIFTKPDPSADALPHFTKAKNYRNGWSLPHAKIVEEPKHEIWLPKLLNMDKMEAEDHVVVIGDSWPSDMGLAYNNNCRGFMAEWGNPTKEQIEKFKPFEGRERPKPSNEVMMYKRVVLLKKITDLLTHIK